MQDKCGTYPLLELEIVLADLRDSLEIEDELWQIDDVTMLWVNGLKIEIAELGLTLRQGVLGRWSDEAEMFLPEDGVTVFYQGDITEEMPIYYGEEDFVSTIETWFENAKTTDEIENLMCEIKIEKEEI